MSGEEVKPVDVQALRDIAAMGGHVGVGGELLTQVLDELERLRRVEEKANQLWHICVEDGFPWSDGDVQDQLTAIGLLYEKDMRAEEVGPECTNCFGDCERCYRAVERVREAVS